MNDNQQLTLPTDGKELDQVSNQTSGSTPIGGEASRTVDLQLCEPAQARQRKARKPRKTRTIANGHESQAEVVRGRPSSFREDFCPIIQACALTGNTDEGIAKAFGISHGAFLKWKRRFPQIVIALKAGRGDADNAVASALYMRAIGYSREVEKPMPTKDGGYIIAKYRESLAPDPTSMIFWLKNRRPDLWRDRIEHSGTLNQEHSFPPDVLALAKKLADRIS